MQGTTFLQIKHFDLLQQGRTTTVSTLPSSFHSVPWETAQECLVTESRSGGGTEWWQDQEGARRLEHRKTHTVEQNQQAVRGKDRASPYGRMFAGHFCSLRVEPCIIIASFLSSSLFTCSITLPGWLSHLTHSATCVKLQAPFGASACCLCVLPSKTTLCWTLDWQEVAVHSGS